MTSSLQGNHYNKPIRFTGFIFTALVGLFLLSKIILPEKALGENTPIVYNFLFVLGFGVCLSIIGISYSVVAWTRNSKDYLHWYLAQAITRPPLWWIKLFSFSPSFFLWWFRLTAPIFALAGLVAAGLGIFYLFLYLLALLH